MSDTPIEDYLDELLRRTHADPRTTRRLLDEANDHLYAAAGEFETAGMTRVDAEREAVRRFGPATNLVRNTWRRSFTAMVREIVHAAILLGGWGLVAVGVSGAVVALMNALVGRSFVGGATVLGTGGHTITETAHDAVSLRLLAGIVGLLVLAGYTLLPRHTKPATVLPHGLVDALGAAAFAAATVVLAGASVDQGTIGLDGIGFFLSGALISLVAAGIFCTRATHALLPRR